MPLLNIIDECLDHWVARGLNNLPGRIPQAMATGQRKGDRTFWVPIGSTVTSNDIAMLEVELGVKFSRQYKSLLQHKHFLELQVAEVAFFSHPIVGWQDSIKQGVLRGWPREFLLDKGFLPFADYSDWGLWCFGTSEAEIDGECPVYLWDHDSPNELTRVSDNLESGLEAELARARA